MHPFICQYIHISVTSELSIHDEPYHELHMFITILLIKKA